MRLNSRAWFAISLLLFVAGGVLWHLGEKKRKGREPVRIPAESRPALPELRSVASSATPVAAVPTSSKAPSKSSDRSVALHPHRLRNSAEPYRDLMRSDAAILLRNAAINSTNGVSIEPPHSLRAEGDPGSYVAQSRGVAGEAFREALRTAGATIVAYVPNNAFLIRGSAGTASKLKQDTRIQAVIPFEPYFKLDRTLLDLALGTQSLPDQARLNLLLFADEAEATVERLGAMGVRLESRERSPFGELVKVEPTGVDWVRLAHLSGVQAIEISRARVPVNDLARVRLGLAPDTTNSANYLGLTGKGVLVGVNDSGVDAGHPDLDGRIKTTGTNNLTLRDPDGHGTHVAGIIAGSGKQSGTVSNAPGSILGANFRGKAPEADIFALYIGARRRGLSVSRDVNDSFLQETAARTNVFISNNSWAYVGANDYESAAASFDAAVRDSLPGSTGSRPMTYVFAAANEGEGDDQGLGGLAQTIMSPATAKNVISVGSVESPRFITNALITTNISGTNVVIRTNQVFLRESDSNDEVSNFSSRGNVGLELEGEFGRMKPDVVAPGSYIASARSRQSTIDTNNTSGRLDDEMNRPFEPHYVMVSGTSMAAPAVAGYLALVQEFFEQRLSRTNSPALMKALLINGSRSLGRKYDLSPRGLITYQGWGQPSLTNSIPSFYQTFAGKPGSEGVLGSPEVNEVPHVFLDQGTHSPSARDAGLLRAHALATGESDAFDLRPSEPGRVLPMRLTLVWTDPPGNPAAAVKLVNDLDLVVSNTVTRQVYYGNNIEPGSDFNTPSDTNSPPATDLVNNVENVILPPPLGEHYVITVRAKRVNVNAVTANSSGIVQDYALVASIGDGEVTNAFRFARPVPLVAETAPPPPLISVTNGVALFNQRVGAQFPLTNNTLGQVSQWNFYVFTNLVLSNNISGLTNGSNVAFVTFFPPNLGKPRQAESDLDLYVSTNSALTNLDPAAVSASSKSTDRGGTQVVFFTNAPLGAVYYVAVKSEDQQAGEFGLYGLSTDQPFTRVNPDGSQTILGLPLNAPIPDGSPERPAAAVVIGIGTTPITILRARVENRIIHESIGDLTGNLSHGDRFVVLNNHYSFADPTVTNHYFLYDDSNAGDFRSGSRPTDGPGSLNDFMGEEGRGVWLLNMVDNSPSHGGTNVAMNIFLDPLPDLGNGSEFRGTVLANQWNLFSIEVPSDALNFTIHVAQMTGPLDVYARYRFAPTLLDYDKAAFLSPPAGSLFYGEGDQPPLRPGRYIIGLYNPNAVPVNFRVILNIERSPRAELVQTYSPEGEGQLILDDALTLSDVQVGDNRQVVRARVGVRIDHPRAADLVLRLVSPGGTRILLSENRGGLDSLGFGSGDGTNMVFGGFAEDTNIVAGPIKYARPPYTTTLTVHTNVLSNFENSLVRVYDEGESIDGWLVDRIFRSTNSPLDDLNQSFPRVANRLGLAQEGTNYLQLGRARITRSIPTRPGQQYRFSFIYRTDTGGTVNAQVAIDGGLAAFLTGDPVQWQSLNLDFIATQSLTRIDISPAFNRPGMLLDQFQLVESSGTIYYLPEETLKPLEGETAFGRWTLQVEDTRAGPAGATLAPTLFSWQLQLILTRPSFPVTPLQEGVFVSGQVAGDEIRYFLLDVPREAFAATNVLASAGDLVLLYNPRGLPNGTLAGDIAIDFNGAGDVNDPAVEFLILNTNDVPLLTPGQRYYLGVANLNPRETNTFDIGVLLGRGPSSVIGPMLLTNGVARSGSLAATNALDYYEFRVSPNAYNATFELIPVDGNVDLVLRKALPVSNPLPTPFLYDYASGEPGTSREEIIVVTNSVPVPLTPGPWYLGVYNVDSNRVNYTVRVTEALSPYTITPLTNGVPLRASTARSAVLTNYFSVAVPSATNLSVRFDLYDLSTGAELMAKKGDIFEIDQFDFRTNSAPNGATSLTIAGSPLQNPGGTWFLAVANPASPNVNFTIRATVLTNGEPSILVLTNAVARTNYLFGSGVDGPLDFYRFQVSPRAKFVDFELGVLSGEVDLLLTRGPGLPATNRSDYTSALPAPQNEIIRVARGSTPVSLESGPWYVAALNRSDFPATYWIRATETDAGRVKGVAANTTTTEYAVVGPHDYFLLHAKAGHALALVQVESGSTNAGQLGLLLKKGLPVPSPTDFQFFDRSDESGEAWIGWNRQSLPVPLSAGEWYVAVENIGPGPLPYRFSYTVFAEGDLFTNRVALTVGESADSLCVRWTGVAGTAYVVQGTTNRVNPVWTLVSGAILGTGSEQSVCLAKPTSYVEFRILDGKAAPPPPPPANLAISPSVNVTPESFCLSWASTPGITYRVEGKADLLDGTWVAVSPSIVAAGNSTAYCVPLANPSRFFRIVAQ
ncbi:MAG: hypothetical protein FJ404_01555 [Verrucomicrobia bacterium]|nr:hypothetical protein [Verrucomicrobiota bacterium]